VTTPVSVLSQLVEGCGVLLPERSERAVADAVLLCLRDADEYHSLSHAAVLRAGDYSLERWRDAIGSILRQSWGPLHQHV
jgi:hypothetical protein